MQSISLVKKSAKKLLLHLYTLYTCLVCTRILFTQGVQTTQVYCIYQWPAVLRFLMEDVIFRPSPIKQKISAGSYIETNDVALS